MRWSFEEMNGVHPGSAELRWVIYEQRNDCAFLVAIVNDKEKAKNFVDALNILDAIRNIEARRAEDNHR
jgi:hypothetical protein